MSSLWHDLRYAARGLRHQPGFTAAAGLALALGIGAATTIYSVIQNVLLDPFPYADVERLVTVQVRDLGSSRDRDTFNVPEFLDYQEHATVFEDVIAGGFEDILYSTGHGTEQFNGGLFSPNNFQFLGVSAALGRTFNPDDARPGAPAVFVMSHRLWANRFASDPAAVGRTLVLNGVPTTLVGVMPPRFAKMASDLWKPVVLDRADPEGLRRFFRLQGRLKPGVTIAQAEAELGLIAQRLAPQHPDLYPQRYRVRLVGWIDAAVGSFKKTLYTMAAAVGLLLLIACGNVANMLLARATTRQKDMAIRASLGASRGRLVRQLLLESLLLALLGAALGCVFAYVGLKGLVAVLPDGLIPREAVIRLNLPVLAFSLAAAALTSVVFGLAPALQAARKDVADPLRDSGKGTGGSFRSRKLRGALVVSEVAVSLVLVAGAGLLMRSFVKLQSMDLGMSTADVLAARLPLPAGRYRTGAGKQQFFGAVLARVKALPGVVDAAAVSSLPPYGGVRSELDLPGQTHAETWSALVQLVSEGYFRTLQRPLLQGRVFGEEDVAQSRKVAVVNRAFTERYLPGLEPLGRQVRVKRLETFPEDKVEDALFEIVGVVADARNQGLRDPVFPEVYVPYAITGAFERGILVRTAGAARTLLDPVRREIWAVDPGVAVTVPGVLKELIKQFSYTEPRFGLVVLGVFAGVGLVLVAFGVYGVIAYTVARQTHEIGIRMALGAGRGDVMRMVLGMGLRLVGAGVGLGLAASLVATRVLASQLWSVGPYDPLTLGVVVLVVAAAGLAACYLPARRATAVQPLEALRSE